MANIDYAYDQANALQSHTGDYNWTDTDVVISGSALTASSKYLVVARGALGGTNVSTNFAMRTITGDATLDSTQYHEAPNSLASQLVRYGFVGSYTTAATPTDLKIQMQSPDSTYQTVYVDQITLLALNLGDLDSGDYVEDSDTSDIIDQDTWTTGASVSLASGKTWLLLGFMHLESGSASYSWGARLYNVTDSTVLSETYEECDSSSELRCVPFVGVHYNASATKTIAIQGFDEFKFHDSSSSYLIAIDTAAFDDFDYAYNASSYTLPTTTVGSILDLLNYTPSTAAPHLIVGSYQETSSADKLKINVEIDDTIEMLSGDESLWVNPDNDSTDEFQPWIMGVESLSGETDLQLEAAADAASKSAIYRFIAALSLELAGGGTLYEEGGDITVTCTISGSDLFNEMEEGGDVTITATLSGLDGHTLEDGGDLTITSTVDGADFNVFTDGGDLTITATVDGGDNRVLSEGGDLDVTCTLSGSDISDMAAGGDLTANVTMSGNDDQTMATGGDLTIVSTVDGSDIPVMVEGGDITLVISMSGNDDQTMAAGGDLTITCTIDGDDHRHLDEGGDITANVTMSGYDEILGGNHWYEGGDIDVTCTIDGADNADFAEGGDLNVVCTLSGGDQSDMAAGGDITLNVTLEISDNHWMLTGGDLTVVSTVDGADDYTLGEGGDITISCTMSGLDISDMVAGGDFAITAIIDGYDNIPIEAVGGEMITRGMDERMAYSDEERPVPDQRRGRIHATTPPD